MIFFCSWMDRALFGNRFIEKYWFYVQKHYVLLVMCLNSISYFINFHWWIINLGMDCPSPRIINLGMNHQFRDWFYVKSNVANPRVTPAHLNPATHPASPARPLREPSEHSQAQPQPAQPSPATIVLFRRRVATQRSYLHVVRCATIWCVFT